MTKFISELITENTPILKLTDKVYSTKEQELKERNEKYRVLDLDCTLSRFYINYLYFQNQKWYYFKMEDLKNDDFPFSFIDELMGAYLSSYIGLPAVSYQIAGTKKNNHENFGIASLNFKKLGFRYMTFHKLCEHYEYLDNIERIQFLKSMCIDFKNEEILMSHIFKLFALDIYMIQKDRCDINLQFQVDQKTSFFDLAPLYDFSNCHFYIDSTGIKLNNPMGVLDDSTIPELLQNFPMFQKELEFIFQFSLKEVWEKISIDYCFNQDSSLYDRICNYYEIKEEKIKKYIKQISKDVQI